MMETYCSFSRKRNDYHRKHHDSEHGLPAKDDDDLFRRLMLEISQAGLSFDTVLKRKEGIYKAFSRINLVAKFTESDVEKLMHNEGIIRNRKKIEAAIFNAQRIKDLQKSHGSFRKWLDASKGMEKEGWVKLFRSNFRFTGKEIVNEFLMSAGYLQGAHDDDCPKKLDALNKNL